MLNEYLERRFQGLLSFGSLSGKGTTQMLHGDIKKQYWEFFEHIYFDKVVNVFTFNFKITKLLPCIHSVSCFQTFV